MNLNAPTNPHSATKTLIPPMISAWTFVFTEEPLTRVEAGFYPYVYVGFELLEVNW